MGSYKLLCAEFTDVFVCSVCPSFQRCGHACEDGAQCRKRGFVFQVGIGLENQPEACGSSFAQGHRCRGSFPKTHRILVANDIGERSFQARMAKFFRETDSVRAPRCQKLRHESAGNARKILLLIFTGAQYSRGRLDDPRVYCITTQLYYEN